jgi:hypothetical protein
MLTVAIQGFSAEYVHSFHLGVPKLLVKNKFPIKELLILSGLRAYKCGWQVRGAFQLCLEVSIFLDDPNLSTEIP